MNKNQKGSIFIILIVVIALLGIGVAGYFVYQSRSNSSNITAVSNNSIRCDTDRCFQQKFIKCEPASLQQKALFPNGSKPYYEIVGGNTANCKMLYRTDSDNLELICTYQNTGSYDTGEDSEFVIAASKNETDTALGKETACVGPKVEKLKQIKPITSS